MANRITSIISKTASEKVASHDHIEGIKKALANSVNKRLDSQTEAVKADIAFGKISDKNNKIIEAKGDKYKNELEKDISPYLKNRAKVLVSKLYKKDPKVQEAKQLAYNKYIDEFVKNTCDQIDNDIKEYEEYNVVIESVIRSCHDSINNDPELKKEIDTQLVSALQDAVVSETMNLFNSDKVNSLILKENMYITNVGNVASSIINNTTSYVTSIQIDDLLTAYSQKASKNIASSIANNTFGKLTNIPIIGKAFKPLQNATERILEKQIKNVVEHKMNTSWANDIKNIKTFQKKTEKFQQEANVAIQKAESEAKTYMAKFEQQTINAIKKFINIDNLSIGGFKL